MSIGFFIHFIIAAFTSLLKAMSMLHNPRKQFFSKRNKIRRSNVELIISRIARYSSSMMGRVSKKRPITCCDACKTWWKATDLDRSQCAAVIPFSLPTIETLQCFDYHCATYVPLYYYIVTNTFLSAYNCLTLEIPFKCLRLVSFCNFN